MDFPYQFRASACSLFANFKILNYWIAIYWIYMTCSRSAFELRKHCRCRHITTEIKTRVSRTHTQTHDTNGKEKQTVFILLLDSLLRLHGAVKFPKSPHLSDRFDVCLTCECGNRRTLGMVLWMQENDPKLVTIKAN